jgi:hypothetical protein
MTPNWNRIHEGEVIQKWQEIDRHFGFDPYRASAPILAYPSIRHKIIDTSNHLDAGFTLVYHQRLHNVARSCFQAIADQKLLFAFNWQHECYEFNPFLPFETDEFDEWLAPVFPNGDYIFFFNHDFSEGLFVDGIHFKIHAWGSRMVEQFIV